MIMMMIRVWGLGFKGLIKSDNHPSATPHNSATSIHWEACYDTRLTYMSISLFKMLDCRCCQIRVHSITLVKFMEVFA
jgi:hypothetical protein